MTKQTQRWSASAVQKFEKRKRTLEKLFQEVKFLDEGWLKSELARYLCIRISGLIEQTVTDFYEEYAEAKGHPYLSHYISRKLHLQNPKMEKLMNLAEDFSEEWKNELDQLDDQIKDAVDNIVTIRNSAAHGGVQSISLSRVENHYKDVLKLLRVIQMQCEIN